MMSHKRRLTQVGNNETFEFVWLTENEYLYIDYKTKEQTQKPCTKIQQCLGKMVISTTFTEPGTKNVSKTTKNIGL